MDFKRIVEDIPENFTGADFYGLTSQAVLVAVKRKIEEINKIYGKWLVFDKFFK